MTSKRYYCANGFKYEEIKQCQTLREHALITV